MKAAMREYIRQNLEIDDLETIAMLIEVYGKSLRENIAIIEEATQNGNASAAAAAAHALKGASANVGASAVYEATMNLEKRLRDGVLDKETQQLQEKLVELLVKYEQEP